MAQALDNCNAMKEVAFPIWRRSSRPKGQGIFIIGIFFYLEHEFHLLQFEHGLCLWRECWRCIIRTRAYQGLKFLSLVLSDARLKEYQLQSIIVETGLSVRSFAADFFTFCDLSVDLTLLHLESYRKPEFRSAWSQLQELSLRQYVDEHNINWVRDLILGAPNLRCLTLCFGSEHMNISSTRLNPVTDFLGFKN